MDTNGDYKILNINGQISGTLNIQLSRCDENGNILEIKSGLITGKNQNIFELMCLNEEKDLINKRIHFLIKINTISGIEKTYEV